jgi:hypothetical protein
MFQADAAHARMTLQDAETAAATAAELQSLREAKRQADDLLANSTLAAAAAAAEIQSLQEVKHIAETMCASKTAAAAAAVGETNQPLGEIN